jgi:hypothetical protein
MTPGARSKLIQTRHDNKHFLPAMLFSDTADCSGRFSRAFMLSNCRNEGVRGQSLILLAAVGGRGGLPEVSPEVETLCRFLLLEFPDVDQIAG